MPPLKVAFVIDALSPGAGTENQLILLLNNLDRQVVEPAVCCLFTKGQEQQLDIGCEVKTLGFHRLASRAGATGFTAFAEWAGERQFQLFMTFFRDANIVGTLVGRWLGIPVVSNRRNLGRGYWHTPWEISKLRLLNRWTSSFVANSKAVRDYTIDAEKVPSEKIRVIYNAVDTDRFAPLDEGLRSSLQSSLGLPSTGPLVGCVANLRPIKNIQLLIRAFRMLNERNRHSSLALVGTGEEENALRRLVRELNLDSHVLFLGKRSDIPAILRALDMAVLTSKAESLPNSLLEYLASGLPIVATDVGGIPEALNDGEAGRLVPSDEVAPLAETMAEVLSSDDLRRKLSKAARQFAETRFAIPRILDEWHRFFEDQRSTVGLAI